MMNADLVSEAVGVSLAKYAERCIARHGTSDMSSGVCVASLREAVLAAAAHVMVRVTPETRREVCEMFSAAGLAARADEKALREVGGRSRIAKSYVATDAAEVAVRRTVRTHLQVIAESLLGVSEMLEG